MTARITTFTRDGLDFDVRDEGPLDGDVVVLLHGFPQRASSWDRVVPGLHAAGFRTLAPDQRGYSPGARPWGRWNYRITELVGDVVALVDRVGGPVHLVGHDWGAAVGWHVAMEHPDRLRTFTALSVTHPGAYVESLRHGQAPRSVYIAMFQAPLLPELAARAGRFSESLARSGMTAGEVQRFETDFLAYGALPGALGWYRALPFGSPRASMRHVTVPSTLVWSDRDVALDRSGAELCHRYVDADFDLVVLEGVSHWIPEHAPDAATEAILARIGTA